MKLPTAVLAALAATAAFAQGDATMQGPVVKEQYEWLNIWWDCANDPALPRVLLIGDSIACGYSAVVTRELEGKYHVDRLGTSRSINDPVLLQATEMMLRACTKSQVRCYNGGGRGRPSQRATPTSQLGMQLPCSNHRSPARRVQRVGRRTRAT